MTEDYARSLGSDTGELPIEVEGKFTVGSRPEHVNSLD